MEINPDIIQSQFEVSEAQHYQSGTGSYRQVDQNFEVLLGHDSGFDHIAFQIEAEESSWVARTSSIDVRSTTIEGLGAGWESGSYILRYPSAIREAMQPFVIEIIESTDYGNISESLELIIERWIQYWRSQGPMGREQQMGLFGELSVLEKLISSGNDDVVENWTGPEGRLHDFEFPSSHIEVKTTGDSESPLKISSFNQLRPCDPPLFLVMVQVSFEPGRTLPGRIGEIREMLSPNTSPREEFDSKLELARYDDDHAVFYQTEYGEPLYRFVQITPSTDVLHEDRLDRPVGGLVDLLWSLDPRTIQFGVIDDDFWSNL